MAAQALDHATHALLLADMGTAEAVIGGYKEIAATSSTAEETTFLLLALQPPAATELRAAVNAIRIAADAERMGELAVNVAEIARRHHPRHAVPAEVSGRVAELSALAVALAWTAQEVLLSREPQLTPRACRSESAIGELHRQLLAVLIDPRWPYDVAAGVGVALVSRLYERFADHAVRIAERCALQPNGYYSRALSPPSSYNTPRLAVTQRNGSTQRNGAIPRALSRFPTGG
ncbi:hypothetical protein A5707_06355 [Mycobacterium kyorinense]|uniref:PhoU domain-containing protein n=1 Tax=Mycobacterium kyorinense TaxID=487514 RepID=A0A1A2YVE5_9MYCO|nr:hypothetical protein A5707_06355 [Mycobacterium kyorinense]